MSLPLNNSNKQIFNITGGGHNFLLDGMGFEENVERYIFLYIVKQYEYIYLDGKEFKAPAGSFVILKPGYHKRIYKGDSTAENYYVGFQVLNHDFFDFVPIKFDTIYYAPTANEDGVENHLLRLIHEEVPMDRYFQLVSNSIFIELLVFLWRRCEGYDTVAKETGTLQFAVYMMQQQPQKNFTLEEYAEMCNLSKYHFAHRFKKEMGMSPIAYRKLWRLKKAYNLLLFTNGTIEEISVNVGFGSSTYFCTAFKEYYDFSPTSFRKLNKKPT